jgi:hypothetical protein
MRVLGTFATRDIAASMKDRLAEHGFNEDGMIIVANRATPEPPEDAVIEVGADGEKGFAGLTEKVGKTVNALLGKKEFLEGTGEEGAGNAGALLVVQVSNDADAERAVELLTLHQAADIEVSSTE